MAKSKLTDQEVEAEIRRLVASPEVKLAKLEERILNRRRQYMYGLRRLSKRGQELMAMGVTPANMAEHILRTVAAEDKREAEEVSE